MSLIYQGQELVAGRRPGLYLGGKADAKDRDKLERWQVKHILNMTPPKEACIQVSFRSIDSVLHSLPTVLRSPFSFFPLVLGVEIAAGWSSELL
jgi:hypothetical protein